MNNEREQLIMDLKSIKENDFIIPKGKSVNEYMTMMMKYIGDEDPELRDDLIYEVFATWIEDKGYLTNEDLILLLNKLLSEEYAFYEIGNQNDNSVLRRSFSILLVNPILFYHLDNNFLDYEMIMKTKDALLRFLIEEKDLRSMENHIGWIHPIAHVSDGIHAILNCDGINEDICMEFLKAIEDKLCEGKVVFSGEEYERMINFVYYDIIKEKLLSEECICKWLLNFEKVLDIKDRYSKFRAKVNAKNFIRSLYFRLMHMGNNENISRVLIEVEKKLNSYLYY